MTLASSFQPRQSHAQTYNNENDDNDDDEDDDDDDEDDDDEDEDDDDDDEDDDDGEDNKCGCRPTQMERGQRRGRTTQTNQTIR